MVNIKDSRIQLRSAQRTDLDPLFELDQVCFRVGIAYSKEELAALLRHRTCLAVIAEDEAGSLLGFAIGQFADHIARRTASVISIDVAPAYRRQGVGCQLMSSVESGLAARGARVIRLEVAVDDPSALAFYVRLGYRVIRRIRAYYMGSLDAYSMEKTLPGEGTRIDDQ